MAPCRGKEKEEQAISLGPRVAEEENVFGCATPLHRSSTLLSVSPIFQARKPSAV